MRKVLVFAAFVLTATAALGRPPASEPSQTKPMVPLILRDLNGKQFDNDLLKGNILVLDFWATWCAPCIAEIPRLNRMQEEYAERGVKVVGVTLASGPASEVKPFVSRHNMKYTVLIGDDDQTYDLNIMGYPTTYLVTRDWKVYSSYKGSGPNKIRQIESDIARLLEAD